MGGCRGTDMQKKTKREEEEGRMLVKKRDQGRWDSGQNEEEREEGET